VVIDRLTTEAILAANSKVQIEYLDDESLARTLAARAPCVGIVRIGSEVRVVSRCD
jgi:hypothetical protein